MEVYNVNLQATIEFANAQTIISLGEMQTVKNNPKIMDAMKQYHILWDSQSKDWWKQFWNRSYIFINRQKADPNDQDWQMGRNYQLFRYMLACNAYGEYPKMDGSILDTDEPLENRNDS